jgi:uncharacterized protein (DUF58 family)
MDFGSIERTKREVGAEVCALLAFVAAAQQDQVGLCLFADEPGLHLPPEKGGRHVLRLVREVMAAPAGGTGSSLEAVLEHQMRHLKRRALVIVVSDFIGTDPATWKDELGRLARKHDVLCVRVHDPFEERLPESGLLLMEDVESGSVVEVDTGSRAVRERWERDARARRESLLEVTRRVGVDLIEIATDQDVADPIVRCFKLRAKRGGRR